MVEAFMAMREIDQV